MDKLKMHTPDLTKANIAKLAELFPDCVTETRNDDGNMKPAVDFDQLRQLFSDHIVEGPKERYHLNWPGKREALLAANAPIAKTLRPAFDESVNFETTKNVFIEGDNLDALKLLQETYLNQVHLIYIDPPYNTGQDLVYRDDYSISAREYLSASEQTEDLGNRLVANVESGGRYHSNWLSMIYPRLRIARNLLRDDGVIFISIDDNELANLWKVCDEIFGETNFRADIAWQKRYTRSNNTVDFTTTVEHILVYSKSDQFQPRLLPRTKEADARYSNPDDDARGPWKGASFLNPATPTQRPNLCYPIQNPKTGEITEPTTNAWRRSKEEFERLLADGRLYWGPDGTADIPTIKMFLSEARGMTPIDFWSHDYAGNTDDGTKELAGLMSAKVFNNPKPTRLIRRIIEHACGPDAVVVDFFGGSGTTAEAVMRKNAEDGGRRKFIVVQAQETCDPKGTAYNAGYTNIADIAKERIRRAGSCIKADAGLHADKVDVGFRVLKVDSSNMNQVYYQADSVVHQMIDGQIENILPGRSNQDLLFQVLLDWGVDLSFAIKRETMQGKEVFFVDDNALAACFDAGIDEELVKALAARKPLRAVFRDAGYSSDDTKINVEQIFKQLSPRTEVRTL